MKDVPMATLPSMKLSFTTAVANCHPKVWLRVMVWEI